MPLFDHGVPGTILELYRELDEKIKPPTVSSMADIRNPFEIGAQVGRRKFVGELARVASEQGRESVKDVIDLWVRKNSAPTITCAQDLEQPFELGVAYGFYQLACDIQAAMHRTSEDAKPPSPVPR